MLPFLHSGYVRVPFYVNVWTDSVHFAVDPHPSLTAVFKDIDVKREDFSKFMREKFDETEDYCFL